MEFTSPFNGKTYHLYRCAECEIEFWWPLELIPEFYESEFMTDYRMIHQDQKGVETNMRLFFERIPQKSGALLDVGCGNGAFLEEARKRGYEVTGVELDAKSVQVCRNKGLNVFHGTLAQFCESSGLKRHFDVVTFFEVLEHQDRPREFLQGVRMLLKEGGWIGLSVPNRARLAVYALQYLAKVMDSGQLYRLSTHDFPPHHLTRWCPRSLKGGLARLGFAEIQVHPIALEYAGRVNYWRSVWAKWRRSSEAPDKRWAAALASRIAALIPWGFRVQLYCQARRGWSET
jgi:2-polyprenyl-3-methyl-5-hydroxy-6-metoxy-1,4-benzoquinol methylase